MNQVENVEKGEKNKTNKKQRKEAVKNTQEKHMVEWARY